MKQFNLRLGIYEILVNRGFSVEDAKFVLAQEEYEDIYEMLMERVGLDTSTTELIDLVRVIVGAEESHPVKADINNMILSKTKLQEQLWHLLYLAHSQVNSTTRDPREVKKFNLVWQRKSIIVWLLDNIDELREIVDFTTPEWEWIMQRQYRELHDILPTIIHERSDEEEAALPCAKSLYRCLEQGLTPHESLLS